MSGWLVYLSASWFLNTRFSGCLFKKEIVCKAVRIRSNDASLDLILRERERERERGERQTDRQRQTDRDRDRI